METTEELIESYLTAMDWMDVASESDDSDYDEWSIKAADAAKALKGHSIVATVTWPTGRKTETSGEVHSIVGDKVYFESVVGLVEGDARSMSPF